VAHPRRGASIVDRHDRVFSRKGCHVTLVGGLVNFHASGDGPRGCEILDHATVPEHVLNGVSLVQAALLHELLEVVRERSRLMLAAAYDGHGACHAGAAHLIIDAAIVTVCSCSLLTALLAPLLGALRALHDILHIDIGRHFPATAWGLSLARSIVVLPPARRRVAECGLVLVSPPDECVITQGGG
jgi:hypothetical protein